LATGLGAQVWICEGFPVPSDRGTLRSLPFLLSPPPPSQHNHTTHHAPPLATLSGTPPTPVFNRTVFFLSVGFIHTPVGPPHCFLSPLSLPRPNRKYFPDFVCFSLYSCEDFLILRALGRRWESHHKDPGTRCSFPFSSTANPVKFFFFFAFAFD